MNKEQSGLAGLTDATSKAAFLACGSCDAGALACPQVVAASAPATVKQSKLFPAAVSGLIKRVAIVSTVPFSVVPPALVGDGIVG